MDGNDKITTKTDPKGNVSALIPNPDYAYHKYGSELASDYSPHDDMYTGEYWRNVACNITDLFETKLDPDLGLNNNFASVNISNEIFKKASPPDNNLSELAIIFSYFMLGFNIN